MRIMIVKETVRYKYTYARFIDRKVERPRSVTIFSKAEKAKENVRMTINVMQSEVRLL